MDNVINEKYGNRVRVRVCGICSDGDRLLMVNHRGLTNKDFWAPPGGGIEFGLSSEENLTREFLEETNLRIQVNSYLFCCEFVKPPLHAIELFFAANVLGGKLKTGRDPEMRAKDQIIREAKFMAFGDIDALPMEVKHGAFGLVSGASKITGLKGYYKI